MKHKIELTSFELKTLMYGLSNSFDDPDFYHEHLDGRERLAADRINEKLKTEWRKALGVSDETTK